MYLHYKYIHTYRHCLCYVGLARAHPNYCMAWCHNWKLDLNLKFVTEICCNWIPYCELASFNKSYFKVFCIRSTNNSFVTVKSFVEMETWRVAAIKRYSKWKEHKVRRQSSTQGKLVSLVALVPHDQSPLPTGDNSALPPEVRVALPSLLVVVGNRRPNDSRPRGTRW